MSTLEIDFSEDLTNFDDILVSLGGRRRIEILKLISNGQEWTISDIARKLDCKVANVSQQLNILERAGLITKRFAKSMTSSSKVVKPVYDKINIKIK